MKKRILTLLVFTIYSHIIAQNYTYDDFNRLNQSYSNNITLRYTYDQLGNRLFKTIEGAQGIFVVLSALKREETPEEWNQKSGFFILESNSKGLVVTTINDPENQIANPVEGMLVWNANLGKFMLYDGTIWKAIALQP